MKNRFLRNCFRIYYRFKCWYQRCRPVKNFRSEKNLAEVNGIPVYEFETMKNQDFDDFLNGQKPDIVFLGSWPELIPDYLLKIPRLGFINTHPSLLPDFRGTSITRWQVLKGVIYSGVTFHIVDRHFDRGPVLLQSKVEVPNSITPQELFLLTAKDAGKNAGQLVSRIKEMDSTGKVAERYARTNPTPVKHTPFQRYFSRWKWTLENLVIDWQKSFENIHHHVYANYQEDFKYAGPQFRIAGRDYFLRECKLFPKVDKNADRPPAVDSIMVKEIKSGIMTLTRVGEKYDLALTWIQRAGLGCGWSRARRPGWILKLKKGELFPYEQIQI